MLSGRRTKWLWVLIVLLAACHSVPDNSRYVPAGAAAVAGIDLRSLSRKIAWNVITGSKLFREIQRRMPGKAAADAMGGIENAGFDVDNTFFIYTRTDSLFDNSRLLVCVLPIADQTRWEAYLSRAFPDVQIIDRNNRRQAAPMNGLCLSWNTHLLIMTYGNSALDEDDVTPLQDSATLAQTLQNEVDRAFLVPNANPISQNRQFIDLCKSGHDITLWLNYGSILNDMTAGIVELNGVKLSSAGWHDAVLNAGVDFRDGKVLADISYYLPAHIARATGSFGLAQASADMLDRLPKKNMDFITSVHLSPAGVKTVMERAGLFGQVNDSLSQQGLDMDYVLGAFSGDMSVVVSDFSLKAIMLQDSFMGEWVQHKHQQAEMNITYCIGLKDKTHFTAIMDKAIPNGVRKTATGYAMPIAYRDSMYLVMQDNYAVISNRKQYAEGFLHGRFRQNEMNPLAAARVYGYPFSLFVNVKELLNKVDPQFATSRRDSSFVAESRKLLEFVSLNGGEIKEDAYKFRLEINFQDKDENSILEMIDFAMKMNEIGNPHP